MSISDLITIESARQILRNKHDKPSSYNYVSQLIAFNAIRVILIDDIRFLSRVECLDFQKRKEEKRSNVIKRFLE